MLLITATTTATTAVMVTAAATGTVEAVSSDKISYDDS